jgi:hypothetical protein
VTRVSLLWQKQVMGVPVWAVAFVLAAVSPMLVRYVADVMEARVKRRTEEAIAKLDVPTTSNEPSVDG